MSEAAEVVDRLFRRESGRAVATLIRVLGDFDLAEEAVQEAFAIALDRWPVDGIPDNPGAWITSTARNRAIDRIRREQQRPGKTEAAQRIRDLESLGDDMHEITDDRLRLIFTCCHPALPAGIAGGAHAPNGRRLVHAGDRARVHLHRDDDPATSGPREEEDPRRRDPVPGPAPRAAARAVRRRARRAVPDLQRGLQRDRRAPRSRGAVRRGDLAGARPVDPHARRTGGARPPRAHAAAALPAPRPCGRGGRARPAGGPGSLPLGSRSHTGGSGDAGPSDGARRAGPVPGAGGDRGTPRPRTPCRGHRLAADRHALPGARRAGSLARRVAQPGRRGRDGRRTRRGTRAHGRIGGRAGLLLPVPFRARRPAPATRTAARRRPPRTNEPSR